VAETVSLEIACASHEAKASAHDPEGSNGDCRMEDLSEVSVERKKVSRTTDSK